MISKQRPYSLIQEVLYDSLMDNELLDMEIFDGLEGYDIYFTLYNLAGPMKQLFRREFGLKEFS